MFYCLLIIWDFDSDIEDFLVGKYIEVIMLDYE